MGHTGSKGRCMFFSLGPCEGVGHLFKPHLILSKCVFIPEPESQVIWTANPNAHPAMKEDRDSNSLTLTKWQLLAEPRNSCSMGSLLYATCFPHQKCFGHYIYKTEIMIISFPDPGLWGKAKEPRQLKPYSFLLAAHLPPLVVITSS